MENDTMNMTAEVGLQHAVFVDETALKAFMNTDDPCYMRARSLFHELDDLERQLVTTNRIIFETHQWLKSEYSYTEAQLFLNVIDQAVSQDKLILIAGYPEIEQQSRQLLVDCPDVQLSLNEAMNAVVMMAYRIKRIFTFNRSYMLLQKLIPDGKVMPSR